MPAAVNIGTLEGLLRWKADDAELQKSLADVAKKADVSKSAIKSYNSELASIDAAYKRVVASIDPAAAATQKYEKAHAALSAAFKAGLISIGQYSDHLEKLVEKSSGVESHTEGLLSKISQLLGVLGPVGTAGKEAAEGLESIVAKGEGFGELVGSMGALLPVVAALAVALVGVGLAFEAFKFVEEAVVEGLKLQAVIDRLNDSLRTTGSYSGLSGHAIVELAGDYALLTGRSKEEELAAATLLTRFKNLNEDAYPKALDAVNAYARATGSTAEEASHKLGPALDGNSRSLRTLKDVGVDLTKGQSAMLSKMIESGDVVSYQAHLFDILNEKIGKASDVHDTLTTQIGRAKVVYGEFKEGIASEVIPALEDLFNDLVDQMGGWENLKDVVVSIAHDIGNAVRLMVYGIGVLYHQWASYQDEIEIIVHESAARIIDFEAGIVKSLSLVALAAGKIELYATIESVSSKLTEAADKQHESAMKAAEDDAKQQLSIHTLSTEIEQHRQALEGDTDAHKRHRSAQDDIVAGQKHVNNLTVEAEKAIRAYSDALSDHIKKLVDQNIEQAKLLVASQAGQLVYSQMKLEVERFNTVETATVQITKEHRIEVEKLTDLHKKLQDLGRAAEAASIGEKIKQSNDAFAAQVKLVGDLAGRNFDLKHATDEQNKSNAETDAYLTKILTLQSQLTDALDGTTFSSREMAIQLDITRRQLGALAGAESDLGKSIAETTRREHERINSIKDMIDVAKHLETLNNQVSLQTAVSHIDISQSTSLQQVEQQYLTTIAAIGHGSIEEGQKIIAATQAAFESLGINIGNLSEKIKTDLLLIADTKAADAIKLSLRTPSQLVIDQINDILRYMSEGLLTAEQGEKKLAEIRSQEFETVLGEWDSVFSYLGKEFGGLFQQLYGWFQEAQALIQALKAASLASGGNGQLGSLFSLGSSGGSSAGAVAGWAVAAYALFVAWKVFGENTRTYAGQATISLDGATSALTGDRGLSRSAGVVIQSLITQVTDLAKQWHLNLQSLTAGSVTIELNNNKEIVVKTLTDNVGQVFKDMASALDYAKTKALEFATFAKDTDELIKEAIKDSKATTTGGLQSDIDFATKLATQNLTQVAQKMHEAMQTMLDDFHRAMDLFGPNGFLRTLNDFSQLGAATQSVLNNFVGSLRTLYDQLTGHQEDAAQLAEQQRLAYNQQAELIRAQITLLILDTQARIANLQAQLAGGVGHGIPGGGNTGGPGTTGPGGNGTLRGGGSGGTVANDVIQIIEDRNPTNNPQMAALLQVLDNLVAALTNTPPDIAPGGVVIPGAGSGSGRGSGSTTISDTQARKWEDQQSFQMSLQGMGTLQAQLAQIHKTYADELAQLSKHSKERQHILDLERQEIELATKKQQDAVNVQIADATGKNDPLAQIKKKFDDLAKSVIDAGFGAEDTAVKLADLTAAEDKAIDTLAKQTTSNLLGELAGYVTDAAIHAELLRQQEIINFEIKLNQMVIEYNLAVATGKVSAASQAVMDKAWHWIWTHLDDLPGGKNWNPNPVAAMLTPGAGSGSGHWEFNPNTNGWAWVPDNAGNANSQATSALQSLINAFHQAKDGIQAFIDGLNTGTQGIVLPEDALKSARLQFDTMYAKAQLGDLVSLQNITAAAKTLIDSEKAYSPELASTDLPYIVAELAKLTKLPTVHDSNSSLVYTEAFSTSLQPVTAQLESLNAASADMALSMNQNNAANNVIIDKLGTMNSSLADLSSRIAVVESGASAMKRLSGAGYNVS